MKLIIFQSDKGDCLLLIGAKGQTILIDGGMRASYKEYVRPKLGLMREQKKEIDLVYISHIDQDHISGILQMLNDEVAWRVYEYHKDSPNGNPKWKQPGFKRPPEIKAIWHNAFHDQVTANSGRIEEAIAASAELMFASRDTHLEGIAEHHASLITSINEALQLSNRINAKQLGIPLNSHFNGKLAMVRDNHGSIKIGDMKIYVIGPFPEDLTKLRKKWNKWLKEHQETVLKLRKKASKDGAFLSQTDIDELTEIGLTTGKIGDRSKVTSPNLASLMLLVEEGDKSIILTGDGHSDDILKGLKHHNKLNDHGGIHVDVLKIQHHGAEYNGDAEFTKLVTADHYVFCGNGEHENPDLRIIDLFVKSRTGTASQRSKNAEVNQSFKFWFNSTSSMVGARSKNAAHMKKLEKRMKVHKQKSGGKLHYKFFKSAKAEIEV